MSAYGLLTDDGLRFEDDDGLIWLHPALIARESGQSVRTVRRTFEKFCASEPPLMEARLVESVLQHDDRAPELVRQVMYHQLTPDNVSFLEACTSWRPRGWDRHERAASSAAKPDCFLVDGNPHAAEYAVTVEALRPPDGDAIDNAYLTELQAFPDVRIARHPDGRLRATVLSCHHHTGSIVELWTDWLDGDFNPTTEGYSVDDQPRLAPIAGGSGPISERVQAPPATPRPRGARDRRATRKRARQNRSQGRR